MRAAAPELEEATIAANGNRGCRDQAWVRISITSGYADACWAIYQMSNDPDGSRDFWVLDFWDTMFGNPCPFPGLEETSTAQNTSPLWGVVVGIS